MNRYFFAFAFGLGLCALLWVGVGLVGTSPLAVAFTALIAVVYAGGARELMRFRADTAGLARALAHVHPAQDDDGLGAWLATVPAPLQHTVRLRIEGERAALPGPALAPYAVGLLVMLGMLGTFLGLILTFKGTVLALEGSADLQAIRSALAAPIKGLGLAFGTSVAGVAASAMLGLMSALARRERAEAGRTLDACVATVFRPFSLVHQRQETFRALRAQAEALPAVVTHLQALVMGLETRSQRLDERLVTQQTQFHAGAARAYADLAQQVGQSLHTSLAASAQTAADALQRTVQTALTELAHTSAQHHRQQMEGMRAQLADVVAQWGSTAQAATRAWGNALEGQATTQQALLDAWGQRLARFTETFEQRSAALLSAVQTAQTQQAQDHAQRLTQLTALWRDELASLRLDAQRLAERDSQALAERTEWVQQLQTLLHDAGQSARAQQSAVQTLVTDAQAALAQAHTRFAEALATQATEAQRAATQLGASAVDLASVGEAFERGMGAFGATQDQLAKGLAQLESTLQQAMARSDEQLGYFVAQAREVIDLALAAQQHWLEEPRPAPEAPAP